MTDLQEEPLTRNDKVKIKAICGSKGIPENMIKRQGENLTGSA